MDLLAPLRKLGLFKRNYYDYKNTFIDSEHGDRVLSDLIKRFHVLKPIVEGDSIDRAFNEGQRSVVLHIMGITGRTAEDFPETNRKVIADVRRTQQRSSSPRY